MLIKIPDANLRFKKRKEKNNILGIELNKGKLQLKFIITL